MCLSYLVRRPSKGESDPTHKVVPHLCEALFLPFNLILRSDCSQRPLLLAKFSSTLNENTLHRLVCTAEQLQRLGANQIKIW